MTVESLQKKMDLLREGVRQVEAQIQQAQNDRMATLGAIQLLDEMIKEVLNAQSNSDGDAVDATVSSVGES